MASMSDIDYWDGQATDIAAATFAVFSDPDIETHTAQDVSLIVDKFGTGLPGGKILDLGCGIGRLSVPVAIEMHRKVIGADASQRMVALAEQHNGHPWVTYTASYPDEMIAGAFSMLVFQHLKPEHVELYMGWVFKALKLGGRFVLQFVDGDYHVDHDHRYRTPWMRATARAAGFTVRVVATFDARHPEWRWLTLEKR